MAAAFPNLPLPAFEPLRLSTFEPLRLPTFEPLRLPTFEPLRLPTFEPLRLPTFEPLRLPTFEPLSASETIWETLPLERPFGWKADSYRLQRQVIFFPRGTELTISFNALRSSKILGYIPIIGSINGIYKIILGAQEYKHFNDLHLHAFTNRSIQWIVRGALETIPVLGGIICMIMDLVATVLDIQPPGIVGIEDVNEAGYCRTCDLRV